MLTLQREATTILGLNFSMGSLFLPGENFLNDFLAKSRSTYKQCYLHENINKVGITNEKFYTCLQYLFSSAPIAIHAIELELNILVHI